jgi:hypothetical protein
MNRDKLQTAIENGNIEWQKHVTSHTQAPYF